MANEADEPQSSGEEEVSGPIEPKETPVHSEGGSGEPLQPEPPEPPASSPQDTNDPEDPDAHQADPTQLGYGIDESEDPDHPQEEDSKSEGSNTGDSDHDPDPYHEHHADHEMAQVVAEPEEEEEGGGPIKSFLEHLEDLRWTIIKCGATMMVAMIVCMIAARKITEVLKWPLDKADIKTSLELFDPLGGFLITLKLAFYAGLVIALPLILIFAGQFVVPALKRREKKYFFAAFTVGTSFFLLGIVFCYFILLPFSLTTLVQYNQYLGFDAETWRGESYFAFAAKFLLGVGLLFELPVLILTLIRLEVIPHALLVKGRRYMFVVNFAICAMLTPADIVTTILMAISLQIVYEICIVISKYWEKQRKRKLAT